MSQPTTTLALPGQQLGNLPKQKPGPGTHTYSNTIQASLAGPIQISTSSSTGTKASKTSTSTISVTRPLHSGSSGAAATTSTSSVLPVVDNLVLARVTRLQQRQATVEILVVYPTAGSSATSSNSSSETPSKPGNSSTEANLDSSNGVVCPRGFGGIIRSQDVRATEKDRVRIADSFAVGDIVRGVVVSLGDQSAYYISTARNEFGVVMALSQAGNQMHPVSWKEFMDPVGEEGGEKGG